MNRLNVKAPTVTKRTAGFYARLTTTNRQWLHAEAKAQGFTHTAEFLDALVTAARGPKSAMKRTKKIAKAIKASKKAIKQ